MSHPDFREFYPATGVFACLTPGSNTRLMLQRIANSLLSLTGWRLVGEIPDVRKAVFIAAPHTSNWDGFWLLIAKCAFNIDIRFLAKHTLFWWPLGSILRAFGAIPIDRSAASAIVDDLAGRFAAADQLFLALAPEGTRRWTPHWKSGFYRIAQAANVPIVLAFIDYRSKRMGIGDTVKLSGDAEVDMQAIRSFYAPCTGRLPDRASPVVLSDDRS